MDIKKYCINENSTILSAMSLIEENRERCVFVINDNKKVLGVVSQGDILKALCKGGTVYSNIKKIVDNQFIYLKEKNIEQAYKIIKNKKITAIPIISEEFIIRDIILLDDIFEYFESKLR